MSISAVWNVLKKNRFIRAVLFLVKVVGAIADLPLFLKLLAFVLQATAMIFSSVSGVLLWIVSFLHLIVSLFYFAQNYMEKANAT